VKARLTPEVSVLTREFGYSAPARQLGRSEKTMKKTSARKKKQTRRKALRSKRNPEG